MQTNPGQPPSCYREIEVMGTPRQLGEQLGEAAREEVRAFVDAAQRIVDKLTTIPRQRALEIALASAEEARRYQPDFVTELEGVAAAAGVSFADVMVLQIRNQLSGIAENACTSFSVAAPRENGPAAHLAGQNWDSDPELDAFTVVLTRRPTGKPAILNVTQAGLIAYIGLNDRGIAVCLNTLPSPTRSVGVPHYFTVRAIQESTTLDEAVRHVQRANRAIGANIMLATPQGPANLEVTVEQVRLLTDPSCLTHTNHCLHDDFCYLNEQYPELIESHPRKARVDQLLAHGPPTLDSLQETLRDHDGYPRSICRHVNDDPRYGDWKTVFSVILDATHRRMYLARGNPCEQAYLPYDLTGETSALANC